MTPVIAFSRPPAPPPSVVFQVGKLLLNGVTESDAEPRRYHVRPWRPSDGGFAGWKWKNGAWFWFLWPPRRPGEYFTIVRLADGAMAVAPRRWWMCCPRGLPRDDDAWAAPAWGAIEDHYYRAQRWFQ
jgi:hypothetical protein